jgi:RimJ/RimL family protein N-acetyltransferase
MLVALDDAQFATISDNGVLDGIAVVGGGIAPKPVLEMLRGLAAAIRIEFEPSVWAMVEDGQVLGLLSLVRRPLGDGAVEIGYGVGEAVRGRGVCARAVADFVTWAQRDGRIVLIRAETGVANPASQRVLARNGFAVVGNRIDPEDGDLLIWERLA